MTRLEHNIKLPEKIIPLPSKTTETTFKRQDTQYDVIPLIVETIINTIKLEKIVLFGSCARRCISYDSDIDICIILEEKLEKYEKLNTRVRLLEKLLEITDFDIDILICSKAEWEEKYDDPGTFIGKIFKEGKILYGG